MAERGSARTGVMGYAAPTRRLRLNVVADPSRATKRISRDGYHVFQNAWAFTKITTLK